MRSSKNRLTKTEHLALAEHVRALRLATWQLVLATNGLPKSNEVHRAVRRQDAALGHLRAALDTDWHAAINEADFREFGHIYYGPIDQ